MNVEKVKAISSASEVVALIDHAILHPSFTDREMKQQVEAMRSYPVASVCIKPYAVAMAVETLLGTNIAVGTVIGFPHGSTLPHVKAAEAEAAFQDGAVEVDVVVNVGKVLSEDWAFVHSDIEAVLSIARNHHGIIKVIFETDYLTRDDHKIRLCEICSELRVDYVKTSTGFGFVKGPDGRYGYTGATEHDITLMRRYCSAGVGIKPSGAVRTLDQLLRFAELGAKRIGTSSTEAIYKDALRRFGK